MDVFYIVEAITKCCIENGRENSLNIAGRYGVFPLD